MEVWVSSMSVAIIYFWNWLPIPLLSPFHLQHWTSLPHSVAALVSPHRQTQSIVPIGQCSSSCDILAINPWLCDLGQPPASPCGSFWTFREHPYPCHQPGRVGAVSINGCGGRIFQGWIIYRGWLETVSWEEDLVACMLLLDLYNTTWPNLIRACTDKELVGVCDREREKEREGWEMFNFTLNDTQTWWRQTFSLHVTCVCLSLFTGIHMQTRTTKQAHTNTHTHILVFLSLWELS